MAFIAVDPDVGDHPKTLDAARLSGCRHIVDHLVRLWGWIALHRPDGDLVHLGPVETERGACWCGPRGRLHQALLEARRPGGSHGFLEEKEGRLIAHDWHEHQGYWIREQQRKRLRRWKQQGSGDLPPRAGGAEGARAARAGARSQLPREVEVEVEVEHRSEIQQGDRPREGEPGQKAGAAGGQKATAASLSRGSDRLKWPKVGGRGVPGYVQDELVAKMGQVWWDQRKEQPPWPALVMGAQVVRMAMGSAGLAQAAAVELFRTVVPTEGQVEGLWERYTQLADGLAGAARKATK